MARRRLSNGLQSYNAVRVVRLIRIGKQVSDSESSRVSELVQLLARVLRQLLSLSSNNFSLFVRSQLSNQDLWKKPTPKRR
jgi:hypothetical protein